MTIIFNIQTNKKIRKKLRINQTTAEIILWKKLKAKRMGYKFRRQHGIGKYIVDFYCPKLRLAIEIDGDTHFYGKQLLSDKHRESEIERFGIKLLRFLNIDIFNNLENSLDIIGKVCKERELELINKY